MNDFKPELSENFFVGEDGLVFINECGIEFKFFGIAETYGGTTYYIMEKL